MASRVARSLTGMLRQRAKEITAAAKRSIASPRDRSRLANRLIRVQNALAAEPLSFVLTNHN